MLWSIIGVNLDSLDPLGFRADLHVCMGVGRCELVFYYYLFFLGIPIVKSQIAKITTNQMASVDSSQ